MNRPTTYSSVLLGIAFATCVMAMGILGIALSQMASLRDRADNAQTTASGDATKVAELQANATLASRTRAARTDLINLAIPKGGDAAFISQLESLGAVARVTSNVSTLTVTPPSAAGAPGALTLALDISGSYARCMQFLQLLETLPTALSVSTVSFTRDLGGNTWHSSLTVSALSFDLP